ncbi:HAD family hydrolase [Oleiphilus messinensis]|uniref:Phospholysine phosphohistidine inorganic pyrophosphate phosphatase n=1 Tax=Oleiphilus messinensis TaxID=141451 RepID=A0A1Y0IFY8_9GAMM|nr:TIGR01458 family HAD-type hydrolase [Oleiphilus messinensis]ARU59039.1 HAD family hydrolase [Oleiphilus messinensis]
MIKAVFFDLSGVLFEGNTVIPGAVETINRLENDGLVLRFVTNTARKTRKRLLEDLALMGFNILPEQLFTAPVAAKNWCLKHELKPYCLVHPDIKSEFADIHTDSGNAVVLGDAAQGLNYDNLDKAFNILINGGHLIAIGDNRYFDSQGQLHLDAGPFVKALEYAAGVSATVTGKPSSAFFQEVIATTPFQPEEILMVGDDVYGDIQGARHSGMEGWLVKTGKYRSGDELALSFPVHTGNDVRDVIRQRLPML